MTTEPHQDQQQRLLSDLLIHVRLRDQGLAEDSEDLTTILEKVPYLLPFGGNQYDSLHAVIDWDHHLPSKYISTRVFASYTEHESRRLATELRARSQSIERDNLFPEFDVPDYEDLTASERYHFILERESLNVVDTRFESEWRKKVQNEDLNKALGVLAEHQAFQRANAQRRSENLGGPIFMGWSPPLMAEQNTWTLEFWLVTEFDGQHGTALVCMVNLDDETVAKTYMTEVSIR